MAITQKLTDHRANKVNEDQPAIDPIRMLQAFIASHRRAPRVLHIGNIANNAYLNAQILNDTGFNCDVICYDYYHIMGCPEWEDAYFEKEIENHFNPDWSAVNLHGYKRPHWFAQGPFEECITYLHALHDGNDDSALEQWNILGKASTIAGRPLNYFHRAKRKFASLRTKFVARTKPFYDIYLRKLCAFIHYLFFPLIHPVVTCRCFRWLLYKLLSWGNKNILRIAYIIGIPQAYGYIRRRITSLSMIKHNASDIRSVLQYLLLLIPFIVLVGVRRIWLSLQYIISLLEIHKIITETNHKQSAKILSETTHKPTIHPKDILSKHHIENLQLNFRRSFPERKDQLLASDVTAYASVLPKWEELFRYYDAVVGYATDGLLPFLCGKRPYLAYEHGTIRNIPFEETSQGRLCALTYRRADKSFITNCDNIKAAGELQLDNYCFVPHPVNERHSKSGNATELRESLKRELNCDFIIFHPSRQHWETCRHPDWEKGNDILIRGMAEFIKKAAPRAGAVFVDWGKKVDESKKLLEDLEIESRVKWVAPLPNRRMISYIRASDVVADQFYLGAFGSLTPKALLHECPVMLHLDEDRHRWCFPEMPPVINVNTPEGVCAGLSRLYEEEDYRQTLISRGLSWYKRYHSNKMISATLTREIMKSIKEHSAC